MATQPHHLHGQPHSQPILDLEELLGPHLQDGPAYSSTNTLLSTNNMNNRMVAMEMVVMKIVAMKIFALVTVVMAIRLRMRFRKWMGFLILDEKKRRKKYPKKIIELG